MDVLTINNLISIASETSPDIRLHATTVAYLIKLLSEYLPTLDAYHTTDEFFYFVKQQFPKGFGYIMALTNIKDIESYKAAIIRYLANELISSAAYEAMQVSDNVVIPWDVQKGIYEVESLSTIFEINRDQITTMLPVTVNINGPQEFMMTDQLLGGLLVFLFASQKHVSITMFGEPFDTYYLRRDMDTNIRETGSRFVYKENRIERPPFSLRTGNYKWSFYNEYFMQGFILGAIWTGVDHRLYWSDLEKYTKERGTVVTEKLTI